MNFSLLPTITQDAQEPRRIRQSSFALLLAVMALPTLSSCGQRAHAEDASETTEQSEDAQTPENPAKDGEDKVAAERVRVEPVVQETIERSLEAVANVQSLDVVDVLPERAEPVLEILSEEGERVKEGQVLAKLRDRVARLAYQEAEVRVTEAQNEVSRAKRDAARNRQLADRPDGTSLLSERDMENSEQALLVAQTALESAKVRLDQAALDLDRCTLRAPIEGTLTMRDISVGDQTLIGQRAFQVADLDHPRVIFYRPQAEFSLLSPGQDLTATAEAFPGIEIRGKVERVAPVVDADSGTIKVTAILEPMEGRALPTGLLVRLRLVIESRPNALLVPKRGLVHRGEETFVFLVEGENKDSVRMVKIDPGFENPTHLQALSTELKATDVIVTVGLDNLEDGDAVEVLAE
jgi:membrane fusion protein, multidrug efflux system